MRIKFHVHGENAELELLTASDEQRNRGVDSEQGSTSTLRKVLASEKYTA